MLNKLGEAEKKYEAVGEKLSSESATSNMEEYRKLMKEYKLLTPIVEKYREYKRYVSDFEDAKDLMESEDKEMKALAELEYVKENEDEIRRLDFARSSSVFYFEFYCELLVALCDAEIETALFDCEKALPLWRKLFELVWQREPQVKSVFDVFQFVNEFVFIRHRKLKEFEELRKA